MLDNGEYGDGGSGFSLLGGEDDDSLFGFCSADCKLNLFSVGEEDGKGGLAFPLAGEEVDDDKLVFSLARIECSNC